MTHPSQPTHPEAARWMEYLYEEVDPADRTLLETHLEGCPECAARVMDWRRTLALLDADAALSLPGAPAVPETAGAPETVGRAPAGGAQGPPVRRAGRAGGEPPGRPHPALGWWVGSVLATAAAGVLAAVVGHAIGQQSGMDSASVLREELVARMEAFEMNEARRWGELESRLLSAQQVLHAGQQAEWLALWNSGREADQELFLETVTLLDQRRQVEWEGLRAGLAWLARETGQGFQQTGYQLSALSHYLPHDVDPDRLGGPGLGRDTE